jgi:hypothetical protein
MKTKRIGMMAAAMALSLAGSIGLAQTKQSAIVTQQQEIKGVETKKAKEQKKQVLPDGLGLDSPGIQFHTDNGTPPHIYSKYNASKKQNKGKSNRLRYSHNAKLKRR